MDSLKVIFFTIQVFILILFTPQIAAQFSFRYSWCGGNTYTPNSSYKSNLKTVLYALTSDTRIKYGFYNFTAGQAPNRVSTLALCRGDVPVGTCRVCLMDSANLLPQNCPTQTEAFGYSEYCSIYVSNRSIFGSVQADPRWYLENSGSVPGESEFNQSVYALMNKLINQAALGNSELKYSAGMVNLTRGGGVLYGLVQCTPDLDRQKCIECLNGSFEFLPSCCLQPTSLASGVRIVKPSCFLRYDLSSFFGNVPNLTPPPLPPPPPPPLSSNTSSMASAVGRRKKSHNHIALIISLVGSSIFILAALIYMLSRKKKKQRKNGMRLNKDDEIGMPESLMFSFGVIKYATQDFSEDNKIGQGGFATVYKGVLYDGQEIAVKRLSRNLGRQANVQFKNEVLILAKLQHKNLVKLLGFCLHEEEMLLVYEFVANRSLDNFLFDRMERESMIWETRFKIINGVARGLLYLHEESRLRIIHRDLKAGNVLLDMEFNPKIADFGMARLFNVDQTQAVASNIMGTYGYMSPEYVIKGQVSIKSDVFSFGVLILEIISGQRISSFLDGENQPENLLSYAWRNWTNDTARNLVDTKLSTSFSFEILRCIHIGLLCVQENPIHRPTMSSVVLMLNSNSLTLYMPSAPAFYMEVSNVPSQESSSVNEVSLT